MQIVIYFKDFFQEEPNPDVSLSSDSNTGEIISFNHELDSDCPPVTHEEVGKWVDLLMSQPMVDKDTSPKLPSGMNGAEDCDLLARLLMEKGVI
jgi:hypothetical protein